MSSDYVHTLEPNIAEMQHRSHEPSSSNADSPESLHRSKTKRTFA